MDTPQTLSDLAPDPNNPRTISTESAEGLRYSIESFGDLSGITFNTQTGQLVCGHQRVAQLIDLYGDVEIVNGAIISDDGDVFNVRLVDWPLDKQQAANIAANSEAISGRFDERLEDLMRGIRDSNATLFEKLKFDTLCDIEDIVFDPVPILPPDDFKDLDEDIETDKECPKCGYRWSGRSIPANRGEPEQNGVENSGL